MKEALTKSLTLGERITHTRTHISLPGIEREVKSETLTESEI